MSITLAERIPRKFALTARQRLGNTMLGNDAMHKMLYGGSRSGKTFLLCRAVATRAMLAPGSRHAILRFRFNAVKQAICLDTWPKMLALCFPGVKVHLDKTDWYAKFPNGSEVWFGGLDDKERTEKILGKEYCTIFVNESSQIPWGSIEIAITRLAQQVDAVYTQRDKAGNIVKEVRKPLPLRMYYDENPPDKSHWSYRLFELKTDPTTKKPLANPDNYCSMQMNPEDNEENLAPEYLATLRSLSGRMQARFLRGLFRDANPNALFPDAFIDQWRITDGILPVEFVRVVVAVDPSGTDDEDNRDNDAVGIVVAALGTDGNGYLLEDLTKKVGPAKWGQIATSAYERHEADTVVGEGNFGGAMVRHVIQTARPRTPFKMVTASRGKHVRADPIAALCETGRIRFVGYFPELEDQLAGFTTYGYNGERSPNNADAMVWAFTELFPGLTKAKQKPMNDDRFMPTKSAGMF